MVGWGATALAATHYPPGSNCYDCHAVSKAKMVVGTHLIKKSQKTVDLGITGSSTPIRCLFCHEKNAVTAPYDANRYRVPGDATSGYKMAGALDHFDATSLSKHRAELQSTGTGSGTTFDCLDCHTGISAVVVSDGAGNASVHGKNAATDILREFATLLGGSDVATTDQLLSQNTCDALACHGNTVDNTFATGRVARRSHNSANTKVTIK